MTDLPFANQLDMLLGFGTLFVILELARRSASMIFPLIVGGVVVYAFIGAYIPGTFWHRGFDLAYITEVIFFYQTVDYGVC